MGAPEELGKTAVAAVEGLKNSPGLLTVVLLQVLTLGVLYFIANTNAQHRQVREMAMLERCFPTEGGGLR